MPVNVRLLIECDKELRLV